MKKSSIVLAVILCIVLVCPLLVFADDADSSVVFNGSEIVYDGGTGKTTIPNLQPGEKIVFTVSFRNGTDADTDWYVKNDIVKSYEDSSKATGGAYQYKLKYVDPNGSETVLFSSDNVGSDTANTAKTGLHQTSDALQDYFFLDTLSGSQKGYIIIEVSLDGESQNVYMTQESVIDVVFKVVTVETTPKKIVDTGYQSRVFLYVAAAFLCLVILGTVTAKMKRSAAGGGAHE